MPKLTQHLTSRKETAKSLLVLAWSERLDRPPKLENIVVALFIFNALFKSFRLQKNETSS